MGKGKTVNKSENVYQDDKNKKIRNVKYVMREKKVPDESNKTSETNTDPNSHQHSVSLFYKNFKNSTKRVLLTRDPDTIHGKNARMNFYNLVNDYEKDNELSLIDLSKNEIMFRMLNYLEETNALISLNDNSKQFLPYKISVPNIVKLYFYKLFYSDIFDFEVVHNNNDIDINFNSTYINKNFDKIYQQIEKLIYCIWYDGLIIAIKNLCFEIFLNFKKSVEPAIEEDGSIEDQIDDINDNTVKNADPRINLLGYYTQSLIFMQKFHLAFYGNSDKAHKYTSLLKGQIYYKGKRAFTSRKALEDTYQICEELLLESSRPFVRLLNMYYLNNISNLFDFDIMAQNNDFKSYELDGIVTKYHINDMILFNSDNLGTTTETTNNLDLASIYNNPNCVITNITSRDYEIIDYLIKVAANSAKTYYLSKYGKDVSSNAIMDLIDCIDICHYTKKINDIVFPSEEFEINNVDYEKVLYFRNLLHNDDMMKA